MTKRMRYENLDSVANKSTFADLQKWRKERRSKQKDVSYTVPQTDSPAVDFLNANRTHTSITWVGHSTFLIQMHGLNIITDPVWAKRMGFEQRLAQPGISIGELPEIDVVLLSHSHYDHLNFPSIRRLPGSPVYFVPAGLADSFRQKGLANVREFAWWETTSIKGVEFHFVPAQHWTRRTLWDTNRSHWGGWVIQYSGETIYFAGDSGYFRGFRQIGQRFSIDYALIPIGAYEPEWFMSMQHVNPEQAVQAFIDLNAKAFIPMHYGAFRLADDTPQEARDRLQAEWDKRELDRANLRLLEHGATIRTQNLPISDGSR